MFRIICAALTLTTVLCMTTGMSFAAATVSSNQQVLLVLGDSLSAGYGVARDSDWVSLLRMRLAASQDARWRDYSVVNASISGETTQGGLSRLPALLSRHHPTQVILALGANDGLRGLSLAASEKNLLTMAQKIRQAGARTLLVGMELPPNYGASYTQVFQAMYVRVAQAERISLVPSLFADFPRGILSQARYFQADRLHPNEAAQPIMLETLWRYLKP